jgi:hypothetical protein
MHLQVHWPHFFIKKSSCNLLESASPCWRKHKTPEPAGCRECMVYSSHRSCWLGNKGKQRCIADFERGGGINYEGPQGKGSRWWNYSLSWFLVVVVTSLSKQWCLSKRGIFTPQAGLGATLGGWTPTNISEAPPFLLQTDQKGIKKVMKGNWQKSVGTEPRDRGIQVEWGSCEKQAKWRWRGVSQRSQNPDIPNNGHF